MMPARWWLGLLVINAALALGFRAMVPDQPLLSDRESYEWVGEHGLAPGCPMSVYCYRIAVPLLVDALPFEPEARWRVFEGVANTLAGFVVALAVARLAPGLRAPLLATWLAQSSFALTYTAYDPFTADPMVFLIAALTLLAWLADWPMLVVAIGLVGVFAKETVALIVTAAAMAAWLRRSTVPWRPWALAAVVSWTILLAFHWAMDTYAGWGFRGNPATQLASGSWLGIWLTHLDSPLRAVFLLFVPFGFAWAYAVAGFRFVPDRLRVLALGSILPMLALVYVQTPERALGNAFFVIVPLAALFLARLPLAVAVPAAVTNGLLTAKVGLSAAWLPSSGVLVIPAAVCAVVAVWAGWENRSGLFFGASREK